MPIGMSLLLMKLVQLSFDIYVPTWAYGREFYGGGSLDFAPEQTLGFHMGTCGSAFAVHVGFVWNAVSKNLSNVVLKSVGGSLCYTAYEW